MAGCAIKVSLGLWRTVFVMKFSKAQLIFLYAILVIHPHVLIQII